MTSKEYMEAKALEDNAHLRTVQRVETSGMSAWARSSNSFRSGYCECLLSDPAVLALVEVVKLAKDYECYWKIEGVPMNKLTDMCDKALEQYDAAVAEVGK